MNSYESIRMGRFTKMQNEESFVAFIHAYPTEKRFEGECYYVRMKLRATWDLDIDSVSEVFNNALEVLNGFLKKPPPLRSPDAADDGR
jgi:hypothetical protein